ncbi:hypothetical protein ASF17_03605 [Frigoribacterium sp. Leaf263]|uniref:hypothetical protein n=1 Tax=Frigoribacterium sp. Leaf263 TaxID=1736313 RepID=UPI0006FE3BEC|nr:hypothetical protein [Frigoribacterium sp. Leaf263]KQO84575.1 hypothetical protein ASF17_03605 [Frigoribacterium sp. Leaf263]
MSAATLARLSHESLVAHIRARVDVSSDSFYRREPGVSAVRITAYPKRRRLTAGPVAAAPMTTTVVEPTYADFLRGSLGQLASA